MTEGRQTRFDAVIKRYPDSVLVPYCHYFLAVGCLEKDKKGSSVYEGVAEHLKAVPRLQARVSLRR